MASISIRQLALAMCSRKFAELVSYQINRTSFSDLSAAIDGAKSCLPPDIQLEIDEIINNTNQVTAEKRFWNNDCGTALRFFTAMIEKHLSDRFINTSEKELIEIFHIIVMDCAYRARKDPRMISFLQKNGRRPGSKRSYSQQQSCAV
jgi:hypothetical protein